MIKKMQKLAVAILCAAMLLTGLPIGMYQSYAADDAMAFNVGVSGIPVTLKYGSETETLTSGSDGKAYSTQLYTYIENIWNTTDWTTSIEASVAVEYDANISTATSPEDREAKGGNKEYKGKAGTVSYTIAQDDSWKSVEKSITLESETKYEFTVKEIPVGGTTATANPLPGVTVTVGSENKTTDANGKIAIYGKDNTALSALTFSIAETAERTGASITYAELTADENTLYVNARPTVAASDYEVVGSFNGYVKEVSVDTEYEIRGVDGNKVSLLSPLTPSDSIRVTLKPDGTSTPFIVYKNGIPSQIVTNGIKVDKTAPQVTVVTTEAVDGKVVKIKDHGIYSKVKAELLVTVEVVETESGVKDLTLVGVNDDNSEVEYPAVKVEKKNGKTVATFAVESQNKMLKQSLYVYAEDNCENKSEKCLIRKSKDGSTITLEMIAPEVSDIQITNGKPNTNGWMKTLPAFKASAQDKDSGLAEVTITVNGEKLYEKTYDNKENSKVEATLTLTQEKYESLKKENGAYKVVVTATDNSGNTNSKELTVKVDLEKPETSISGCESGAAYIEVPTITVNEVESHYAAEGNRITVKVVRDGNAILNKSYPKVNQVALPANTFTKDGDYKITYSAVDAAGNEAEAKSISFTKDATAPSVSLDAPNEGGYFNTNQSARISVTERYFNTNKVNITVSKTLNGNTSYLTFPWKNTGVTSSSSMRFSEVGTYRITVYAVDKAGNRSATLTRTFTVDTKAPEVTIGGVDSGRTYSYNDVVAPTISYSDDYLADVSISVKRAGQEWGSRLGSSKSENGMTFSDFEKLKDNDGNYVISVTVSDKAGNKTSKEVAFTVNRFGSYFKFNKAIDNLNNKAVKNVTDTLVIDEFNVSELEETKSEITQDGAKLEKPATSTKKGNSENGYNKFSHTFEKSNFDEEGVYELNVSSTDTAGNTMESKEEAGKVKFIVDRTAPTITAKELDEKYIQAEQVIVNVRATDNLSGAEVSAFVNGEPVSVEKTTDGAKFTLKRGFNQEVEIVAKDGAGNSDSLKKTVSVEPSSIKMFLNRYGIVLGIILGLAVVGGVFWFILGKKKNNKKEA